MKNEQISFKNGLTVKKATVLSKMFPLISFVQKIKVAGLPTRIILTALLTAFL